MRLKMAVVAPIPKASEKYRNECEAWSSVEGAETISKISADFVQRLQTNGGAVPFLLHVDTAELYF